MTDFTPLQSKVARIIVPGDGNFDEARSERIWNQRVALSRAPAAIVCIESAEQARDAIAFAREQGLKITVRGHGHNYEGAALREGTLMLDIAALDSLDIDESNRTAIAGAAASGGQLLEALEPRGLAFPIGHCSNVPLSGYVMAGGFGWNAGEWGPAAANVTAIELVTAAGEMLTVDRDNHADLFWAARGSGSGFFAAVLRYHLTLHPLPRASFTWSATFPIDAAPHIADWLTQAAALAAPESEIICLVGPDHESGEPAVIVRASASGDSHEDAQARVAAFLTPPPGVPTISGPKSEFMDFAELTKLSAMPNGKRVYCDQAWSDATLGELLMAIRHLADVPNKSSSVNLFSPGAGNCIPRCGDGSCALSVGGGTGAGIYAMWDDAEDDDRHMQWVRDVDAAIAPFRTGRYVGEANLHRGPEWLAECFTEDALARIERLRGEWDPDNLFGGFPV